VPTCPLVECHLCDCDFLMCGAWGCTCLLPLLCSQGRWRTHSGWLMADGSPLPYSTPLLSSCNRPTCYDRPTDCDIQMDRPQAVTDKWTINSIDNVPFGFTGAPCPLHHPTLTHRVDISGTERSGQGWLAASCPPLRPPAHRFARGFAQPVTHCVGYLNFRKHNE
jgi:hypothetical protein